MLFLTLVGVVLLGPFVAPLVLQASIFAANKIFSPVETAATEIVHVPLDDQAPGDSANPYAAPVKTTATRIAQPPLAMHSPTYVHALGICLLAGLLVVGANLLLAVLAEPGDVMFFVTAGIDFLIASATLKVTLPTTFGKATFVVFVFGLVVLGLLGVLVGINILDISMRQAT